MAIDITEKVVDILVNGNQQASYDQRANSANYDVSVSGDYAAWNWSLVESGTVTSTTAISLPAEDFYFIRFKGGSDGVGYDGGGFSRDGGEFAILGDLNFTTEGSNSISGDTWYSGVMRESGTIWIHPVDGVATDYEVHRANGNTAGSDPQGGTMYAPPTSVSVDGVTQS